MDFKTGDILRVNSLVPFVSHYAIVFSMDGKQYAAHNSFTKGQVLIIPLEEFLTKKEFLSHIRNCRTESLTDQEIINKINEIRTRKYSFWSWNCEDFTDYVCPDCTVKTDQRIVWGFGLFFVLLLIILSFKYIKTNN